MEYEVWFDCYNTASLDEWGISRAKENWYAIDGHFLLPKNDTYDEVVSQALAEFNAGDYTLAEKVIDTAQAIGTVCRDAAAAINGPLPFTEFKERFDLMTQIRTPWLSCFAIDDAAGEHLRSHGAEYPASTDVLVASIEQLPNSLTNDQKALFAFKERIESTGAPYDLSAIEKADAELAKELSDYQQSTEYIGTHHMWGDPRTMTGLLSAIENSHELSVESTETFDVPLLGVMAKAGKWRLECAQSSAELAYALRPSLEEYAKKLDLTYDDIIYLTTAEVEAALEAGAIDKKIIDGRREAFAIYRDTSGVHIETGDALSELLQKFDLTQDFSGVTEIKGNVGSKGIVRGKVAVIKKPQDMQKMQKGMILVAPETTPDFIPAMSLAAAFVTDIGGITSHAAIVAREMNKPCVIDTKVGTQVFSDGDEVEVDADNGVVRILESASDDLPGAIADVDWEFYLEREQPLFVFAAFAETYGPMLKAETDFGFIHQLHYFKHGLGSFYRSKKEMDSALEHFAKLLDEKDERITQWLDKEKELPDKLDSFKALENLEEILDTYLHATLFNPTINYRLQASTEHTTKEVDHTIVEQLEESRSRSFYPFFIDEIMPSFFARVGELIGVSAELATNLTPVEIRKIIKGEGGPDKSELEKRIEGCYFYLDGNSITFYYGEVPSLETSDVSDDGISGTTAFGGKVQGTVRIINSTKNMGAFEPGDVLVSINTNPSLMPVIQKAAAIVTDEGGITCHAAIVSRELEIPCVIGTKNATKVLKDGDKVEVDADNGTVRILTQSGDGNVTELMQRVKDDLGDHEPLIIRGTFTPLFVSTWSLNEGALRIYWHHKDDDSIALFDLHDYKEINAAKLTASLESADNLVQYQNEYAVHDKAVRGYYHKNVVGDYTKLSDDELISMLKENQRLFNDMVSDTLCIEFLDKEVIEMALEQAQLSVSNVDEIYEKSIEGLESFEDRHRNLKIKFAQKDINDDVLDDASYLYTDYQRTKSREEIAIDLKSYTDQEAKKTVVTHESFDDDAAQKLYNHLRFAADLRDERKDIIAMCQALFKKLAFELGGRIGFSEQDCYNSIPHDYFAGLSALKERKSEVMGRKNGFELYAVPLDTVDVALSDNSVQSVEKYFSHADTDAKEITGTTACPGVVTGTVRIVLDPKKADDFEEGDVLVTSMTRPEFVPLMKKSGAIITNEGGVTCHAAIVSRELNIPCVIGTKHATQVLKDEDTVEVNADEGIVTIVK